MEPWELLGLDEGERRKDVIEAAFQERLAACSPDEVRALYDARDALLPTTEQSFDDWFRDPEPPPADPHEGHFHVPETEPIDVVEPLPPAPKPRPPPPRVTPTAPPPKPKPKPKLVFQPRPKETPKPSPQRKQPKRTWRSGRRKRAQVEKETTNAKALVTIISLLFTAGGIISMCNERKEPYRPPDPAEMERKLEILREKNVIPDWNDPESVKRWREKMDRLRERR